MPKRVSPLRCASVKNERRYPGCQRSTITRLITFITEYRFWDPLKVFAHLTQLIFRKTKTQILCESSYEPWNVLIFQVRGEKFSELEACVAEVCFDGAFRTFHTGCDGFDGHFMNIV